MSLNAGLTTIHEDDIATHQATAQSFQTLFGGFRTEIKKKFKENVKKSFTSAFALLYSSGIKENV